MGVLPPPMAFSSPFAGRHGPIKSIKVGTKAWWYYEHPEA